MTEPLKHIASEWDISDKLGDGSFGQVFKAKKLNGIIGDTKVDICAIKKIEKNKFDQKEIDNIKKLDPEQGFLKYYGYGFDDIYYYIYMEHIEGAKSIKDTLKCGSLFDERNVIFIIRKAMKAVLHLHDNNIAHRDIKSDHFLLIYGDDNELEGIKLIDFECSNTLETNGNTGYMAPDAKSGNGKASDIWSLGCVMLELFGGDLNKIDGENGPVIPNIVPIKIKQIIQKCLVVNPNGRSSIREIIMDFIVAGYGVTPQQPKPQNINDAITSGIDKSFNQVLTVGLIPNGVTKLDLESYNQVLEAGVIPNSVTDLNLPSYDKELTAGVIPDSVTDLNLSSYNHPLTVGVIPQSVTKLNLFSFDHPLTVGVIPNGVTYLELSSYCSHQLIAGVIPNGITYLDIEYYNQVLVAGVIPESVTNLKLSSYNHPLTAGIIPNSVNQIDLESYNQVLTGGAIPNAITDLNLPSYNHPLTAGVIPNSVTKLDMYSYNHPLIAGAIPDGVTYIDLPSYNHPLTVGAIPDGVKELLFKNFNQSIKDNEIPNSVTSLDLGDEFNPANGNCLPTESIFKLICGFKFSEMLSHKYYPPSVVNLSLPNYNLPLQSSSLTKSITFLELGSNFKHFETLVHIPSTVILLKFGDPEFGDLSNYLLKIKPFLINSSVSKLIFNGKDVSKEFEMTKQL